MTDFIKRLYEQDIIRIGIIGTVVLIIIGLTVSYWSRQVLIDRNEFINDRIAIDNHINKVELNVILQDLGLRGFFMIREEGMLIPYEVSLKAYRTNIDDLKSYAEKYNYPHVDSIDYIKKEIGNYANIVATAVTNLKQENTEAVTEVFSKDPGYDVWKSYAGVLNSLKAFFAKEEETNRGEYELSSNLSFISQLLLMFVGLPVLIFVSQKIGRNTTKMKKLFTSLDESNRKYIFNAGEDESAKELDEINIIKSLIDNLRKTSGFIQSITDNNLQVKWEGFNKSNAGLNENTISGELIKMREQMLKVKDEENKRFWVTDGLSKFSEIVRLNQDNLEALCEVLISQVIRYTKSNQGGLFLLKEEGDNKFLELMSSYAYERKKFFEKRVELGHGILGQAFLEGETIKLSEIPENYLNITSGLGKALPKNLLLVPLKNNETVVGVMELASFQEYEVYHIEFLEKLAEIVSSAIINAKSAQRTKELLLETQQNEEEMKSQEEEMRQNMEELQATQEEMQRKEKEYLTRIASLEDQLKEQQ